MKKNELKRTENGPTLSDEPKTLENRREREPIGTKNGPGNIPTVKVYYREDYVDKHGKNSILLVVHIDKKRMNFNTGVKIEPKYWDAEKKKVRSTHPEEEDLNLIINTSKAKLNNIFVKYRLQDKMLTYEILKDEYERPNLGFDYLAWMDLEIKERRGTVTDSSINQFRAHMLKLKAFKGSIAFAELTEDLFLQFNRYMMLTKKNKSNTRWNTLKTHRTFMNIAKRKGIITFNPLDHMPVKRAQTDRVFLDEAELKTLVDLYRKQSLPDNYQNVLRYFLFSCYTGLRISDLQRIRMEDIISGILMVVPKKTKNTSGITVRIPLSKTALELIRDESPYRVKGLIFHCLSEQKMREYLIHFGEIRSQNRVIQNPVIFEGIFLIAGEPDGVVPSEGIEEQEYAFGFMVVVVEPECPDLAQAFHMVIFHPHLVILDFIGFPAGNLHDRWCAGQFINRLYDGVIN